MSISAALGYSLRQVALVGCTVVNASGVFLAAIPPVDTPRLAPIEVDIRAHRLYARLSAFFAHLFCFEVTKSVKSLVGAGTGETA